MVYSSKMQLVTFRWFLNIILAGIIFSNAEAGRLLGIQALPLHFSAVWPATGFSLAALLLFGYRAWPGVFVGNLLYNSIHLLVQDPGFIGPFFAAFAITLGSLAQALVGAYVMRTFSSRGYFKNVRDVLIFLLAGGFLTCMIAATVGVITFYIYGVLPTGSILSTWLTFWSGDCMGVYIFTPLLIVWSLRMPRPHIEDYRIEALAMVGVLVMGSLLFLYARNYPPVYAFIPLGMWVSYRFGFHGATLVLLLISGITITTTIFGHGTFIYAYPQNPLLVLVMFLETLVFAALFVAAIHNELEDARKMTA